MSANFNIAETPGLLGFLETFVTPRRRALIERVLSARTRYLSVVVEDIWHSPNASAVIRSCECFGIQDMYVIENSKPFKTNTKVVQGSAKWIDLKRFNTKKRNNTASCFKYLRREGCAIAATTLKEGKKHTPLDEIPLDRKLAVCFGCEETGLSDFAHENADYFVKLPMYGFTESFNISVSVALVLQTLCQRLRQSNIPIQLAETEKAELRLEWVRKSIKNSCLLEKRYEKEKQK
ncbi:MAG: RNA methyltransferase [Victivallaceae bacterium]|nr:RNA methyltransferase [Victivallaceae bacterium]